MQQFYELEAFGLDGLPIKMDRFRGKTLLIVNTASACRFTSQYKQLQQLYDRYKDQGFEILAFPSNDFYQEKLTAEGLHVYCHIDQKLSFPVFDKIHVTGKNCHPIYTFLIKSCPMNPFFNKPRWNFHKYLLDGNGKVIDFFYTKTNPVSNKITNKIENLLSLNEKG